ncbi:MAG TPA: hypothetical protein VFD06_00470 [Candidatus Polarisedimenticolia bacterium]|nr:hypothetical protein [Candidatus Polarisedimenticolia bacterium]
MPPLANTISPTLVTIPGFGLLALHVALTLSVLAALIERPFVTRAGVSRFALCASLQANFITTLVGLLCTPIAFFVLAFPALLLVWWPLAVWLSYRVECWWYRRSDPAVTLNRLPVLWGNLASNLVFFVLLAVTPHPSPSRLRWLHSLQPELTILTGAACAATYVAAFVIPMVFRNRGCPNPASIAPAAEQAAPVAASEVPIEAALRT